MKKPAVTIALSILVVIAVAFGLFRIFWIRPFSYRVALHASAIALLAGALLLGNLQRIWFSISMVLAGCAISIYLWATGWDLLSKILIVIYILGYASMMYSRISRIVVKVDISSGPYNRIERLHRSQKISEARALLSSYSTTLSGTYLFELWMGILQYESGEYRDSIEHLTRAKLKSSSDDELLCFNIGLSHYCLGDYSEAKENFEKCVKKHYRANESLANIASAEFCLGKYKAAEDWLERIRAPGPDLKYISYIKGLVAEGQGHSAQAREQYKTCLSSKIVTAKAALRLASLALDEGMVSRAVALVQKISKRDIRRYHLPPDILQTRKHWALENADRWTEDDRSELVKID